MIPQLILNKISPKIAFKNTLFARKK